jgi:hypothetical protein
MNQQPNEYRYIAYDEASQRATSYGPKAVFALQKADEIDSNASIHVIDAGIFGCKIWTLKLGLSEAERLISNSIALMFRTPSE